MQTYAEGAPAIFSAVGGLSDIATLTSAGSGLVNELTVDGWAAALSRALEDPDFRDRERRLGPERVRRHFSYRRFAEEIAQGYRDAIHRRRRLRYGACKAVVT